jgi:hypothetical protein
MKSRLKYVLLFSFLSLMISSCKKENGNSAGTIMLIRVKIGKSTLTPAGLNKDIAVDSAIVMDFTDWLDTVSVRKSIFLKDKTNALVPCSITYNNNYSTVIFKPISPLNYQASYLIQLSSALKGADGEGFPGTDFPFTTVNGTLLIETITLNQQGFQLHTHPQNIDWHRVDIEILLSDPLDPSNYQSFLSLSNAPLSFSLSDSNKKVIITNTSPLTDYTRYYFNVSSNLKGKNGFSFSGFTNFFYTALDSTYKFPALSDDQLLDLVQHQTFRYFYDFAHPSCGMARERNTSGDVVAMGGSGFGVMGLVVGINRGFITRDEGLARFGMILHFLETCDRFHGAWPHWLNGTTGKVVPFGPQDDGGDIVETSYMAMGLLTMRQYLDSANVAEKSMIGRVNILVNGIDWNWYTQGQNVLYWNWSPDYGFAVNVKVQGYNETLITYIVAASSSTHPITAETYHQGYARNGAIHNGNSYYGYLLPLGDPYGGPLFFTEYTYLGLDPRNLNDQYANYWMQNVNQSLINYSYCVADPNNFIGYSAHSWGLTASDNPWGYAAQSPGNDLGVISPTAAVSALPYTPVQSMNAIKHFYYILGNKLWGSYGFYDAFDVTEGWWASSYIAIDEGPIIGMIENYRSQLLWNLFMSCPEIQQGLTKLGFTY